MVVANRGSNGVGRTVPALLAGVLMCALPGCASWDLRGDGYAQDVQGLTEGVRPAEPKNERWGFSTKSQQIERNLGVGE